MWLNRFGPSDLSRDPTILNQPDASNSKRCRTSQIKTRSSKNKPHWRKLDKAGDENLMIRPVRRVKEFFSRNLYSLRGNFEVTEYPATGAANSIVECSTLVNAMYSHTALILPDIYVLGFPTYRATWS